MLLLTVLRSRRFVQVFAVLAIVLLIGRATVRMPARVRWLAAGSVALAAWGISGLLRSRP